VWWAIERNEARIQELELEDFAADILALCADAAQPQQLLMAGLSIAVVAACWRSPTTIRPTWRWRLPAA
jgi:hypothetical protein